MWQLTYTKQAADSLENVDKSVRSRIYKKINWLAKNFADIDPQPLAGELHGRFKLRIGDWRVIYKYFIDEKRIHVLQVGHRRDIYER